MEIGLWRQVVLPLTDNQNLSSELGTRHRAGIGVTEISDAVAIIVSEETGTISLAQNGRLSRHLDAKTLKEVLSSIFEVKENKKPVWKKWGTNMLTKDFTIKLLSLVLAFLLWLYVMGEENPEIPYEINDVPVKLINSDTLEKKGLIVLDEKNYTVNVKVRGRRSDVLNIAAQNISVLQI